MLKHIEDEKSFKEELEKGKVLVDFYATWCGPCKMLSPILEELAEERSEIKILKVDVDICSELAREYGIMSVPTLLFLKEGELISKKVGFMDEDAILETFQEKEND